MQCVNVSPHLLEAVQVAVNVHGGPCQDKQAWCHLLLQVLQVGLQQRLEHGLHVRHQLLKLTHLHSTAFGSATKTQTCIAAHSWDVLIDATCVVSCSGHATAHQV